MASQISPRSLEIIGRNVVSIREQCNAILLALADIQDDADKRGGSSQGRAAAEHAETLQESDSAPANPDAPAGAPILPPGTSRVFSRGDIRTTPSGERIIRPTFGKPNGEPISGEQSTEDVTQ